jgi:hypothetical protein
MEFKELLEKLSVPVKPKLNEEDQIKAEENNLSDVILNVNISVLIFSFLKKIQILLL